LQDLYETVGSGAALSVSVDDESAGMEAIRAGRDHGVLESMWLNHHDLEVLTLWRDAAPEVGLVNATSVEQLPVTAERRAAELASLRVEAVSLPEADWSGGLVTLFHRFGVLGFASAAHYERQLVRLLDIGIDAVVGEHADRMAAVAATFE
jgi:glycerophosphoryl diester phosphodiesterase